MMFPSIDDLKPISVPNMAPDHTFGWSDSMETMFAIKPATSELFKLVKGNGGSGFHWEIEIISGDAPKLRYWACLAK
ncbi:hypothetical protein BGW38_000626, partial [Lunasporangiospora selenospora]